jgi:hypothetical protein
MSIISGERVAEGKEEKKGKKLKFKQSIMSL